MARRVRNYLGISSKEYRQMLSSLRKKINIVETLMSQNRWDEIEFDKIPSRAGFIYRNAFARRDIIAKKYEKFIKSDETKVNASVLYPYDIVRDIRKNYWNPSDMTIAQFQKYWDALPDYFEGKPCKMMCVVDTSASMTWGSSDAATPMDVALSLGMYCAERIGGEFHGHYISFSSRPTLVPFDGVDIVDKVRRAEAHNLCENTNLTATFDYVLDIAKRSREEDIPETLVIISDMEIDAGSGSRYGCFNTIDNVKSEMDEVRKRWAEAGLKMPRLVYWNVNARNDTILDLAKDVSCVSGANPIIFKQIMTGKTGYDLCLEAICNERYNKIKA